MEHLIPPGAKAPVVVPVAPGGPDKNGEQKSQKDYQGLVHIAMAIEANQINLNHQQKMGLWMEFCEHGRSFALANWIQFEFWIGRFKLILGDEVPTEDFIVDSGDENLGTVLSTAKLEHHLNLWAARVAEMDDDKKAKLKERAWAVLEQGAVFLRNMAWFVRSTYAMMRLSDPVALLREPLGMTHFACVVLHQALVCACGRVLDLPVRAGNPLSLRGQLPWLRWKMALEGWCPSLLWQLNTVGDIDELVYGYYLGTVRTKQDHSQCSEEVCLANKMPDSAGVKHVDDGCECALVEAPMDSILQISRKGGVPVLMIGDSESGELILSAEHMIEVAMSEQATSEEALNEEAESEEAPSKEGENENEEPSSEEGLNEEAESEEVIGKAKVVAETESERATSEDATGEKDPAVGTPYLALSHVWIDGLGSPNANVIATCQLQRVRARLQHIVAFEEDGKPVYWGEGTLGFWLDTLCIPVDPQHQDLRNKQIAKMHSIFKNAEGVLVLDADTLRIRSDTSMEEIGMRLYMSAWKSRLWTYQEGSLNSKLLLMASDGVIDVDSKINWRPDLQRFYESGPLQHNLIDLMARATIFGLGRPHYDSNTDASDYEARRDFFAVLDRLRDEGDNAAQKMLQAIRDRSSSRTDDEAVIIGTFMGLDALPVLEAAPEDRMATLLKAMPHIPANLLFAVGPRLTQPGCRWAPRTVLRSKGGAVTRIVSDVVPLRLEDVESGDRMVRFMSTLDPGGRGLKTFNPAIRFGKVFMSFSGRGPSSLRQDSFDRAAEPASDTVADLTESVASTTVNESNDPNSESQPEGEGDQEADTLASPPEQNPTVSDPQSEVQYKKHLEWTPVSKLEHLAVQLLGRPFAFSGVGDRIDDTEENHKCTGQILDMVKEGKDLAILLAEFDPGERIYGGVLIEILSETKPLMEQKGDVTKAKFLMIISIAPYAEDMVREMQKSKDGYDAEWLIPRLWLVD